MTSKKRIKKASYLTRYSGKQIKITKAQITKYPSLLDLTKQEIKDLSDSQLRYYLNNLNLSILKIHDMVKFDMTYRLGFYLPLSAHAIKMAPKNIIPEFANQIAK